ncbi:MAG: RlmE family RNA methyltransferase [Candidatus Thermoplasmatota archaeon]|nr:RlmE family RNA methyltransferase [Candidatus Thermoplasmatota archaeon]
MPTRWYRERKGEGFYRKAKREGYRARSAYKLLQINDRYEVIGKGDLVVDLGAAPGGWSQVARELGARVVAVDLDSMKPLEGVSFIKGDITEDGTVEKILQQAGAADAVISDLSPNLTGNYVMDQARSVWLTQSALRVAERLLVERGNFVCKVFMGEDYPDFLAQVEQRFTLVKAFSPQASRKRSSEIYLVAKNFAGATETQ